ncbi:unnamed protein product [Hermetia illucens]|uniref:LSM12 anticodon-binding domain-containing protein n=1 Tax=Hermetia illucens TaxID=343691 RepID=A0A7R8V0E8_HERIL|nr:LSM12 homolog A [Hermetia illucens]CAD7090511.1 unnamed protein product [Hermetia illucens]
MAAVGDCFSIGSIVACKTCFDQTVEGEVLAFDQQTKMLILKCPAKASEKLNDVYILNLQFCSDVKVKKEVCTIPDTPQSLNLQRLKTRLRNSVEQRQRWAKALAAGVSNDGLNVYMAIAKQLPQHVRWSGQNIVIFDEVTVSPPYNLENITTNNQGGDHLLGYVKKLVGQFFETQAANAAASAATTKNPQVGTSNTSVSPAPTN